MTTLVQAYSLERYISPSPENVENIDLGRNLQTIDQTLDLGIESRVRERVSAERLELVYPQINPSFLSMKHPQKHIHNFRGRVINEYYGGCELTLPRFAIYNLDSPFCSFDINVDVSFNADLFAGKLNWFQMKEPKSHRLLDSQLRKTVSFSNREVYYRSNTGKVVRKVTPKFFQERFNRTETYSFATEFNGIIPQEVKRKLDNFRKIFGENLYIVTEAQRWDLVGVQKREVPVIEDPLVIGVKAGKCFLLDQFDTTPLEEYVSREFNLRNN
ncbi:MAG: hypothetical protein ABH824_06200 [Nanoarchaeota archaeon]